jgi:hypothetical protein
MSNKQETPVRWLVDEYHNSGDLTWTDFNKALEMESKKQQKYDEMINVLERASDSLYIADSFFRFEIEQLIKEAKEL